LFSVRIFCEDELKHTLWANFATDYNVLYVRVFLRLVAGQDTWRRDDDIDSLHEGDPFFLGIASDAKGASIVQGT
jgi:hypothetical protein